MLGFNQVESEYLSPILVEIEWNCACCIFVLFNLKGQTECDH